MGIGFQLIRITTSWASRLAAKESRGRIDRNSASGFTSAINLTLPDGLARMLPDGGGTAFGFQRGGRLTMHDAESPRKGEQLSLQLTDEQRRMIGVAKESIGRGLGRVEDGDRGTFDPARTYSNCR